mmetsp:Transcript_8279/g.17339  ORF Transcript_8279/g.17339 Transcript_8279/m.17339 type:complete len:224 (+) Transcript_8279:1349-2020(+)
MAATVSPTVASSKPLDMVSWASRATDSPTTSSTTSSITPALATTIRAVATTRTTAAATTTTAATTTRTSTTSSSSSTVEDMAASSTACTKADRPTAVVWNPTVCSSRAVMTMTVPRAARRGATAVTVALAAPVEEEAAGAETNSAETVSSVETSSSSRAVPVLSRASRVDSSSRDSRTLEIPTTPMLPTPQAGPTRDGNRLDGAALTSEAIDAALSHCIGVCR